MSSTTQSANPIPTSANLETSSRSTLPPLSSSLPSRSKPTAKWRAYGFLGLVGLLLTGVILWTTVLGNPWQEPFNGPVWTVGKERLKLTIVERGTLESAENSDIFCRVKAGAKGSTIASTIKWIIDDGSHVDKGQKLIELDDSGLQDQLKSQNNTVHTKKSEWIQAEENYLIIKSQNNSDVETAKIAVILAGIDLEKYREGDYIQTLKDIQGRIEIARSDLEMWRDRSAWSERMSRMGFQSRSQAESDRARRESSDINLKKVEEELNMLEKYNKKRNIIDLQNKLEEAKRALDRVQTQARSKLVQAEIDKEAKRSVYLQEEARRTEIEDEIRKCVVYSPQPGLVVYFMPEQSRFGSGSQQSIVAQGEPVREGQKLMRIPNLSKMLVNARVHEAMVSKVRQEILKPTGFGDYLRAGLMQGQAPWHLLATQVAFDELRDQFKEHEYTVLYPGQKATIRIDAFPTKAYTGHVKYVANVASQSDFLSSDVKVYQTNVSMDGVVEDLKPGMSAEVTILAAEASEPVLSVPIQAVVGNISMGAQRKCFVLDGEGQPRERDIVVGFSNDKMVEVKTGLEEGDRVVLNPRPLLGEKSNLRPAVPGKRSSGGGEGAEEGGGGKAKAGKKAFEGGKEIPGSFPGADDKKLQRPEGDVPMPGKKQGKGFPK